MKKLSLAALAAVSLGALAFTLTARPQAAAPQAQAAIQVATELARTQDVPLLLDAPGSVTPLRSVLLRSQLSGMLTQARFAEGARVRKGQVLARVDTRIQRARLKQATGQLQRHQALLDNAVIDLERYRAALGDGSVTQQTVDTQRALVAQYKGDVLGDQGLIDELKVEIGYGRIVAPMDGRISLRHIDPGNLLQAGEHDGVALLETFKPITVVFGVPDSDLRRVLHAFRSKEGIAVQALDRARKGVLDSGRVIAIDNHIDSATGTVNIKAQFENKDGFLFPNQFVQARMQLGVLNDALLVPSQAVRHGRDGDYLFTVGEDNKAVLHKVQAGPSRHGYTVIKGEAIAAGAAVVVDGADRIEQGTPVKASLRTPPAAAAPPVPPPAPPTTPKAPAVAARERSAPADDDRRAD